MKNLILISLFLSGTCYAQKLKDRIQGDWVCIGIFNTKGQPSGGKFGGSDEYLKFSFRKSKLAITEAPFDVGLRIDIVFKDHDAIDLIPFAVYDLPERIYEVKDLTNDQMTLVTKGQNGEPLSYRFVNQKNFDRSMEGKVIDQGILIVKHLTLSKTSTKNVNRVFEYRISNDSVFLGPSPTFEHPQGGTFGHMLSFNMKLPKDFKLDEPTSEMVVEFDVSNDGVSDIKIVKGLSTELDAEVVRVIEKLKKNWKALIVDEKPIKTTLRFHLYFYMTYSELQLPWK